MPSDTPLPGLLDAAKASASKLKEKQAALDARAKELDALKVRLDAERVDLESRAARLTTDRQEIERERQALEDVRASMERDLAAINDGRNSLTKDEERLQRELKALEDRERTIQADVERVERLERAFAGQMTESESRLHNLLERAQEHMKVQANWLAAFESREMELHAISEEIHSRRNEVAQQHDSLAALKDAFKDELNRLLSAHEALATKERSVLEAEKYLASALQIAESDFEGEELPAAPPSAPAPPEPVAPPPTPEPTVILGPVATPVTVPIQEEIADEPEANPPPTKEEATDRLARAVEAWKRARNAGWKVSDIRKTAKLARDAVDAGDCAGAFRLATEILDEVQATLPAR